MSVLTQSYQCGTWFVCSILRELAVSNLGQPLFCLPITWSRYRNAYRDLWIMTIAMNPIKVMSWVSNFMAQFYMNIMIYLCMSYALCWLSQSPLRWIKVHQNYSHCFSVSSANLTLNVRGASYLGLTRSISWLLMPWLLASPGHQYPWYWPCRIGRSIPYWREYFTYLCHVNMEECHKM